MIEPPLQIAGVYTRSICRGGSITSRPYKLDPFVGAARITSRPCCSICRGDWFITSRTRYCRGDSITSRPYKKFVPLLKIVFHVVAADMPSRPGAGYADQKKLYLEFNRAYQTTICPACVCSGQKKNLL